MPIKIPPPSPVAKTATPEDLFKAIREGNPKAAAHALRGIDRLDSPDLELLADLFSGDIALPKLFPFRIELKPLRPGRPSNYLKRKAGSVGVARLLHEQLKQHPSVDAAIKNVMLQTGKSYTTVWRVYEMWIKKP